MRKTGIMLVTSEILRDKIYTIRGQKVMLDYDLAKIYGYETRYFNRQIKNNIERFNGEEFMFQLNEVEFSNLMCKNFTSSSKMVQTVGMGTEKSSNWGGTRKLPYAFTEQGIYMLMTVLRGELAVRQSRELIMLFKRMKDYIIETERINNSQADVSLISKVLGLTAQTAELRLGMKTLEEEVKSVKDRLGNTIKKSEISDIINLFSQMPESQEYVFMKGELARADEVFVNLFSKAKSSIHIIDDYIDIKTLRHLQKSKTEGRYYHF